MLNSQLGLEASKPNLRRVTRWSTVRIFKENIDGKIIKARKYAKWMALMQMPSVFPALLKYCSFDYNAYLIKQK
jgi:hypothetical protein